MIYRLGETRRQRRRRRVLRNLKVFTLPIMLLVICGTFTLHNSAFSESHRQAAKGEEMGNHLAPVQQGQQRMPNAKKPGKVKASGTAQPKASLVALDCMTGKTMHAGLKGSSISQLRKLAEYEQVCGAGVIDRASFFVPTPTNAQEARDYALDVSITLHEFSRQGIVPLVFMEPTTGNGTINLKDYRAGAYDGALDAYFAAIKSRGISDQMMGMWVPFPENNIPVWGNVDPTDYVANVTRTIQFQKKHFPSSKASVMLESKTYPSGSSWTGGAYVSLRPYLEGIPKGLIDSFGLQGFPWVPPAAEGGPSMLNPKVYLPVAIATEAASILGVQDIWVNTGTFSRSYAQDPGSTVKMTAVERQGILNGVITQAKAIKAAGFQVSVHIFAEDKSATAEGIDWSYWAKGHAAGSSDTDVLRTFIRNAADASVPLWLFDSE